MSLSGLLFWSLCAPAFFLAAYRSLPAVRLRVWLLMAVLAPAQLVQYWLAIEVSVDVWGLPVSPGSSIVFPLNLFIVLLAYIKRTSYEFKKFLYLIVLVNVGIAALAGVVRAAGGPADEVVPAQLVSYKGIAQILAGTALTVADVLLMAWLVGRQAQKEGYLPRTFRPLLAALAVDAVGYSLILWAVWGRPLELTAAAHLASKTAVGVWYALLLGVYLRHFEPDTGAGRVNGPNGFSLLLHLLQYRRSRVIARRPPRVVEVTEQVIRSEIRDLAHDIRLKRGTLVLVLVRPSAPGVVGWEREVVKEAIRRTNGLYSGSVAVLDGGKVLVALPDGEGRQSGLTELLEHFWVNTLCLPLADGLVRNLVYSGTRPLADAADPARELIAELESQFLPSDFDNGLRLPPARNVIEGPTMIVLTDEQWREYQGQPGRVGDVLPPVAAEPLVLLPKAEYLRLKASDPAADIPPGVVEAMRAYWAEVNRLAQDRRFRGQWVLYHRSQRVGVAPASWQLYAQIRAARLNPDDCYVSEVAFRDAPPWVPVEVRTSAVVTGPPPAPVGA